MVLTFGVLLFLIFVIEIAAGIAAYVYRNEVEQFLRTSMNETLVQEKADFKNAWDEMQTKLKCCGVNGPNDYAELQRKYPISCCEKEDKPECLEPFQKGCFETVKDKLKSDISMVGGVGVGIAVIEIVGVMFAWCLASAIKKEYEGV